jgi:hypothetical protein
MSKYAIVEAGTVTNVAVASGPLESNWISIQGIIPQPGIGWSYNGATFAPPPEPAPTVYKFIKAEYFWERFTNAELVDYEVAMQHDPAASNNNKKDAAKLRIFRADTNQSGYRNIEKNKVTSFVTGLESAMNGVTVLAAGRANTILTTPITAEEAYQGIL